MTIFLEEPFASDKQLAQEIQIRMQVTVLNDILEEYSIHYDPNFQNSSIVEDLFFVNLQNNIYDEDLPDPNNLSPWVLRLKFSRWEMFKRKMFMRSVRDILCDIFEDDIYLHCSSDNAKELIIQLRLFKPTSEEKGDDDDSSCNNGKLDDDSPEFIKSIIFMEI